MAFRKYPEEIEKLMRIYKPFVVNCQLQNPTEEAKEAFEKVKKWAWEQGQ